MAVPNWLKRGTTPTLIIAATALIVSLDQCRFNAVGSQLDGLGGKLTALDAKIDRQVEAVGTRVAQTNTRIDRALEMLTEAAARDAKAQSDLDYLRGRIDRITEKLEIASDGTGAPTYVRVKGGKVEGVYEQGATKYEPVDKGISDVLRGDNVYEIKPIGPLYGKRPVPFSREDLQQQKPKKETPDK